MPKLVAPLAPFRRTSFREMMRLSLILGAVPMWTTACNPPEPSPVIDRDGDQWIDSADCNDEDASTHPFAPELCDGQDNDCDGETDESPAVDAPQWFADADGDGYGDPGVIVNSCTMPSGYVANADDCNDGNASVNPEGEEVCDGKDNDCNGEIDEPGAAFPLTWYRDADADGYGDFESTTESCLQPEGYVDDYTDCDDTRDNVNPGAPEVCDDFNIDEDCDGAADDDDPSVEGTTTWYVDADRDTHGTDGGIILACEQPEGFADSNDDCDDTERTTNPSAREICGDGVDNNCDGLLDGEDATARPVRWYADADSDGYGDAAAYWGDSCDNPGGLSVLSTDCDDTNPDIHPDAVETWYDGVDQDCGGEDDFDADADGYPSLDYTGDDCDDADPEIYPSHVDVCGDGIDNDCDGVDPCDVNATWAGASDYDVAGASVAAAGDLDGDGMADLLIGADREDSMGTASGSVYVWTGITTGSFNLDNAPAVIRGEAAGDHAGAATAGAGDVNGDGINDILVGAYDADYGGTDAGAAYLVLGPVVGEVFLSDADARLDGETDGDQAGFALSPAGDIDGDGFADILVGAWSNDTSAAGAGAAYVFRGPLTGHFPLWTGDVVLQGENGGDQAGWSVGALGDTDGDGLSDIAIGAPYAHPDGAYRGGAYVVYGGDLGTRSLATSDAFIQGENSGDLAGWSVAGGDANGDGYADILIGAPENDTGGSASGAAYLVLGPLSGPLDLGLAWMTLTGENNDDQAGFSVAVAPDIDGDGGDDLLIGAAREDSGGSNAGAAYLVLGASSGTLDLSNAHAKVVGNTTGDNLGTTLAGLGDANGDAYGDLVIGAPFADASGTDSGSVSLVLGGGWPLP